MSEEGHRGRNAKLMTGTYGKQGSHMKKKPFTDAVQRRLADAGRLWRDDADSCSDTSEAGFRGQTASPWSRISDYTDSSYGEGIMKPCWISSTDNSKSNVHLARFSTQRLFSLSFNDSPF